MSNAFKKTSKAPINKRLMRRPRMYLRLLFDPFLKHYLKQVEKLEQVPSNITAFPYETSRRADLRETFISLRLKHESSQNIRGELLSQDKDSNLMIWDFLREVQQHQAALVILGAPGSGKTTLMQHIVLACTHHRQYEERILQFVPILIFLRQHITEILKPQPLSLAELISNYCELQPEYPNPPPGWFERMLEHGHCIVLLDGLDEVADQQDRQHVANWVGVQMVRYQHNAFILTSRPKGFSEVDLPKAKPYVAEILPLNQTQIKKFIHQWYQYHQEPLEQVDHLVNELRKKSGLNALTVNPLLLTMLIIAHINGVSLTGSRANLYKNIVEVLLAQWDEKKDVVHLIQKHEINLRQKLKILQALANKMMEEKVQTISYNEALQWIHSQLKETSLTQEQYAGVLPFLSRTSGLIQEVNPGMWSFAHHTFQEYLTAAHWVDTDSPNPWDLYINDSWWQETLRLYADQKDATTLIRRCLEMNTPISLRLMSECLPEVRTLDQTVRENAEHILRDICESLEQEHFIVGAEYLLNKRLRRLEESTSITMIDTEPITWAEYQLFLYDSQHYPDHWNDEIRFPQGQALDSVVGIRGEDAELFCSWITELTGGLFQFRLPQGNEDLSSLVRDPGLTFWSQFESEFQAYGLTDDQQSRYKRIVNSSLCKYINIHTFYRNSVIQGYRYFDRESFESYQNSYTTQVDYLIQHARMINLDIDLAYIFNIDQALSRFLTIPRNIMISRFKPLVLAHDQEKARLFAKIRKKFDKRALDHINDWAMDFALYLAYKLDKHINNPETDVESVETLIEQLSWEEASSKLQWISLSHTPNVEQQICMLEDLLNILSKEDASYLELKHAWCQYKINLDTILYNIIDTLINNPLPSYSGRQWQEKVQEYKQLQQEILSIHTWLVLTQARVEGKIPAWESFVIVRTTEQA